MIDAFCDWADTMGAGWTCPCPWSAVACIGAAAPARVTPARQVGVRATTPGTEEESGTLTHRVACGASRKAPS